MFGYNSYDVDELYRVINNMDVDKDVMTTRKTLRKILMSSSGGKHVEKLFPAVVKHLSSTDLMTKKLVCWFLCENDSNQEFILLAVNTLVKDCNDPNPMVRGLSLRTLTSLPHPFLLDYSFPLVLKGLSDSSVYVRRAAVLSCITLSSISQEILADNGMIDKLYEAIRDCDSIVILNALMALEEILKSEGGIVINHNIAIYLLNKLQMFNESQLSIVMTILAKYKPADPQETLDIMNIVDPLLRSGNAFLLVQTVKYFLKLVGNNSSLKQLAVERARDQLLHLLTVDNPEMIFVLLEFIETLLTDYVELFLPHHRLFFCRYNEPVYVKLKKIHLLSQVTYKSNLSEVVEELGMYSLGAIHEVASCAVNALCRIGSKFPTDMAKVVEILINLLDLQDRNVLPDVLNVLQSLDLKQLPNLDDVLKSLEKCASSPQLEEVAKPAIVWLLGEYGQHLDSSPYIIEGFVDELSEKSDPFVCESLLISMMKLFLKRPAECQDMLGKVLEKCSSNGNVDLQHKATFYYNLLMTGTDTASNFIL